MWLDRDNDQELYNELVTRLRRQSDGTVQVTERDGWLELDGYWEGDELMAPLRLHVTPRSVGEHLRDLEGSGDMVFPGTQPILGALQLFLIHIDEAVLTRADEDTELTVESGGVRSAPRDSV